MSDAFVASRVCLQVVSMVAFADAFLAMSIHAFRVWSICVLYIARCASGTWETTQASYFSELRLESATDPIMATIT